MRIDNSTVCSSETFAISLVDSGQFNSVIFSLTMRSFISTLLISIVLLSPPISAAQDAQNNLSPAKGPKSEPNGVMLEDANSETPLPPVTVFNGIEVPPMKELNGTDFERDIKDGYWYDPLLVL